MLGMRVPSLGPISFIFMQFLGKKSCQIIGFRQLLISILNYFRKCIINRASFIYIRQHVAIKINHIFGYACRALLFHWVF